MTESNTDVVEKEEAVELKVFKLLNRGLTDWYSRVNGPKKQPNKKSFPLSKEEKSSLFPYCR